MEGRPHLVIVTGKRCPRCDHKAVRMGNFGAQGNPGERATNEHRILTWQEEKRGLRGTRDQLEQGVVELTDKLSECHSRLAKQDPLHITSFTWLSSPLLMSPSSEQQTSRPSKSSPKVSGVFRNTRSAPSSSTMSHLQSTLRRGCGCFAGRVFTFSSAVIMPL